MNDHGQRVELRQRVNHRPNGYKPMTEVELRERTPAKVYVVMGNDFPDAVFAKESDAEAYIQKKKEANKVHKRYGPGIYYRTYEFEVE